MNDSRDWSCLVEVINSPREFFEMIKFNFQKKTSKTSLKSFLISPDPSILIEREKKEISNVIKSNTHNNHKTQNLTTNEGPSHCQTHKWTYPVRNYIMTHYRETSLRSLKMLHVSLFSIMRWLLNQSSELENRWSWGYRMRSKNRLYHEIHPFGF